MARCKRCLIPDVVPGVQLDSKLVCNLCYAYVDNTGSRQKAEEDRRAREDDLEATLRSVRSEGARYDCLVPFSGGKDSAALLYRLKTQYGLNILAFTSNINLPPAAWRTIRRTVAKLEIDHVTHSPTEAFFRKLFSYLLRNQEARGAVYTVSYVYAPLFEGEAIRLAIEKQIPLVLAGYSPGQPEPERMLYEFSPQLVKGVDWTPPHLRGCGEFTQKELDQFHDPRKLSNGNAFPRYLAPFHAWPYDQAAVIKQVVELGLVARRSHASPVVSNYPINWLMMYSDLKNFGYNPYIPEFAALIRQGKASYWHWRLMVPIVDQMIRRKVLLGREVAKMQRWLGLSHSDLKITLPKGAYDPVVD